MIRKRFRRPADPLTLFKYRFSQFNFSEAGLTLRVEVGKKGYIIIPKSVRELIGIREGDTLILSVNGNRIILEPERRVNVDEVARKIEEHRRKVSYAKRPVLGELAGTSLEEEFED
jgi:AbrB family looped-hinge helix DNA binding protein